MKRLLLAVALVTLPVASVSAQLINFDDLSCNNSFNCFPIPAGYAGLNWVNFGVLNSTIYLPTPSGYVNGMISSPNVAVMFGEPASFSSIANPFTLNSGYFTAAWNDGLNLNVTGFVGGFLTFNANYTLNTQTPSLLIFDWANLSSVSFVSSGGVNHGYNGSGLQFALDNLTISQASVVPEPASMTLLGTGLVGLLGGAVRRRRTAVRDAEVG